MNNEFIVFILYSYRHSVRIPLAHLSLFDANHLVWMFAFIRFDRRVIKKKVLWCYSDPVLWLLHSKFPPSPAPPLAIRLLFVKSCAQVLCTPKTIPCFQHFFKLHTTFFFSFETDSIFSYPSLSRSRPLGRSVDVCASMFGSMHYMHHLLCNYKTNNHLKFDYQVWNY